MLSLVLAALRSSVLDGMDGMMDSYLAGLGLLRYSALLLAARGSPRERSTSAVLEGRDEMGARRGFCVCESCR